MSLGQEKNYLLIIVAMNCKAHTT